VTITQTGVSVTSPETNTKREKGNVGTDISATIQKRSNLVPITDWKFQYSENGGTWTDTGFAGTVSGDPLSFSTGISAHYPSNTINNVRYRVVVDDEYTSFTSNNSSQINFVNMIFYGSRTSNYPSNSNEIRSLQSRVFVDGSNTFILTTGLEHRFFVVAMPQPKEITQAIDLDSLNAPMPYLTGNINLNSVDDFAGNSTSYNVYGMSISQFYTENGQPVSHDHQITRS
jgi:hypothetical protein